MKYGELNLGQIEAMVNKLGGMEGVRRFLSGDLVAHECEPPFRVTDELRIQIPALARPTLQEFQAIYPWVKSIERDTSSTEAVTMNLGTILRSNEERVSGKEYERRIAPKQDLILGYQHAKWLVEHQDEFPSFCALLGKVYVDFTGLIVVDGYGLRRCPCLGQDGRRWCLRWCWVDLGFRQFGRLALSSK